MVNRVENIRPIGLPDKSDISPLKQKVEGDSFGKILDKAVNDAKVQDTQAPKISNLEFSKHALSRLYERNIKLSDDKIGRLEGAIDKAKEKGSLESLVITDDAAFIVNVPKRKIITAMDKAQMMENVFTNIDSTVIA